MSLAFAVAFAFGVEAARFVIPEFTDAEGGGAVRESCFL